MTIRLLKNTLIPLTGILFLSAIIRLSFLETYPPGGPESLGLRMPSAIAGIGSIVLFMIVVGRLTRNKLLTLISGLVLTLNPWHIEQSRVQSEVMLGLVVLLVMLVILLHVKNKIFIALTLCGALLIFYLVYPSFWLFHSIFKLPPLTFYMQNFFKLISIEFIFFTISM